MSSQTTLSPKAAAAHSGGGSSWIQFGIGLAVLIGLTVIVTLIDDALTGFFRSQGLRQNLIEYPLVAVLIGLIVNALLRLTNLTHRIKPAIKTETYLRIGVILLGARVNINTLLATGAGGLIQAVIMVSAIFLFTWWLGGRMKLPDTLRAVMASAVSICGVSAAVAAAGSVQAKKEEITYVTALVIVTALPLMVLMPVLATALNLPADVAGAWFGGNIDTTAAVIGAGTLYGEEAQAVATIVKSSQNVLMGFVAFALALYFVTVVQKGQGERPSPRMIWDRFPKFILGFVAMSILASTGVITPELSRTTSTLTQWIFTLAFICIGLEFSVSALREAGARPIVVYLAATVVNTVLALGVAWVIFGGLI
ncbi:MAG: YeiH family protein [Candidatus Flexifilum sp.]